MPVPADEFPELSELPPRKVRRTARGFVLRWLLRGLVGALLLVLIAQLVRSGWNRLPDRKAKAANKKDSSPIASRPPHVATQGRAWEHSVVAIQSRERTGRQSHGSGFLVGDTGLVATNLHVSSSCTEAVVRFSDGTTYEVQGYAAVDPTTDLALLKLKDAPASLIGLRLNDAPDPPRRTKAWAVGHPEGVEFTVSPGEIRRVLSTGDLPAESQRFLSELTGVASSETKWIQHSAPIAPGSSGGPLVDEQGTVLGINTWVNRSARLNYALHVAHLHALLRRAESSEFEPLAHHATSAARMSRDLWQLSAPRLQELLEQGRDMNWLPQSAEEYRILQQLAWAITIARRPDALAVRGSLGDQLDELAKAADAASLQLQKEKWNEAGQVTILNEFAAEQLRRPRAGLFLFATIERVVEQDSQHGLIATLAGFEQSFFIPLEDQLAPPGAGAQVLVLGVNYQGRGAPRGEDPLKLNGAPIIVPGVMIELE